MSEENQPSLFLSLVYSLNLTAMQQLGKNPDPMTGETKKELEQASLTVEMLEMLEEKTKNNLTTYENEFLNNIILKLHQLFAENQ